MLQRLRCIKCGATLLVYEIVNGIIEIMCRQQKCKHINRLNCQNNVCSFENKTTDIKNIASR